MWVKLDNPHFVAKVSLVVVLGLFVFSVANMFMASERSAFLHFGPGTNVRNTPTLFGSKIDNYAKYLGMMTFLTIFAIVLRWRAVMTNAYRDSLKNQRIGNMTDMCDDVAKFTKPLDFYVQKHDSRVVSFPKPNKMYDLDIEARSEFKHWKNKGFALNPTEAINEKNVQWKACWRNVYSFAILDAINDPLFNLIPGMVFAETRQLQYMLPGILIAMISTMYNFNKRIVQKLHKHNDGLVYGKKVSNLEKLESRIAAIESSLKLVA